MEKIYPYLDIIFLVLIVIFLLFMFYRLIGKKSGLQRNDKLETNNIGNDIRGVIKHSSNKEKVHGNIEVYAEGSLNAKLQKVKELDTKFSFKEFINYCKDTFTKIVTNFNKGNLEEIKDLISPKMYEFFIKYIQENNINNTVDINRFLLVDIIDVDIEEDVINIQVKFVTKQNINDELIEIREIWYFVKNYKSDNKLWYVSKVIND